MTEEPLDPAAASDGPPRDKPPSRARLILTVMLAVVLVIALFTPQPSDVEGRYTTHSTGPFGTQLIYDLSARLGWKVQRRTSMQPPPPSPHVVNVVLEPDEELDATEVHALLENVRAGGGLLVAGSIGTREDSLGYLLKGDGTLSTNELDVGCDGHPDPVGVTVNSSLGDAAAVAWRRPPPSPPVVFAYTSLYKAGGDRPAFVGVQLGLGRMVIAGTGGSLRNDVVRRCRVAADVAFVRALEYLRGRSGAPTFLVSTNSTMVTGRTRAVFGRSPPIPRKPSRGTRCFKRRLPVSFS